MSKQNSLIFWGLLALTALCGVLINFPYHNFQNFLAQGDHGRDLYAAAAILRGEMPYKNFWWVYGPLMPYYYALFFKIFGIQISSVLLGKCVLNIAAGIFFYLGLSRLLPAIGAFAAAVWFMSFHQDFFFTYNHAGGIAILLACVWMHLGYIKTSSIKYAWGAIAGVFIMGLIKINFAVTALLMTLAVVGINDYFNRAAFDTKKKIFACVLLIGIPLAWFSIYALMMHGLSLTEIRQCLPYLGGDEPYNNLGPMETIPVLWQTILKSITASFIDIAMCAIIVLSTIQTFYLLFTKKLDSSAAKTVWILIAYVILFYIFNLHEFIKSGVFYRAFWSQPFSMMLSFIMIATACASLKQWIKTLLWASLLLVAALGTFNDTQRVNSIKNPQHFLGGQKGNVYISNDRFWIQTVVLTTKQLGTALKPDELFLALPYDCLYYYLTGKKSPTRQLIFFDHIKIPPEQEQTIIAELEGARIGGILVSSRQNAREHGLGTLGVSYCPFLTQYINTNFTPAAKLGDWANEPGWAWNHGTLILKRK